MDTFELTESGTSVVGYWLFCYLLVSLFEVVFCFVQSMGMHYTRKKVEVSLRSSLFNSIMKCETGYFDGITTGELTSCLDSNITRASHHLTWGTRMIAETIVTLGGNLILSLMLDVRLTIASCVMHPLALWWSFHLEII
eukprot:UN30295